MKYFFIFIILIFSFSGCGQKIEKKPNISSAYLQKINWDKIKGFDVDNLNLALKVFQKDCKARRVNQNLKDVCKQSIKYTNGYKFFTSNFTPYRMLNKRHKDIGLITGYYEPILNGSFIKTDKYKYPIYKTPKDLITVKLSSIYPSLKKYILRGKIKGDKLIPYESRKELINVSNKLEVLLYVDNKIDKFFLEIQGSGKVKLPNGKIVNLAYAQQNGRKYYAIGRKLISNGAIKRKDMSLQSIRKWCENNPSKVDALFNLNQSVVFFEISSKSATGSLGIELVAHRNLAIDTSFILLGFPVFLNTTHPISQNRINSLMIAGDTGGAIKGDVRADYFWGSGEEAKNCAGKMAQKGKLTLLIPNKKRKTMLWLNNTHGYKRVKLDIISKKKEKINDTKTYYK